MSRKVSFEVMRVLEKIWIRCRRQNKLFPSEQLGIKATWYPIPVNNLKTINSSRVQGSKVSTV